MKAVSTSEPLGFFRIGLINLFVFIGLLRLTNLNFYISKVLGFEVEINNLGGNAFNFNNYAGVGLLGLVILTKALKLEARWRSAWPLYTLMFVYLINAYFSPYANSSWLLYQELFLMIGVVMHLFVQKVDEDYVDRFKKSVKYFFGGAIVLISLSTVIILANNSWGYYIQEFNEVFVQSLDDYGIMKQRYGYMMGFVLSYAFFLLKDIRKKLLIVLLVILTGFGIRSFLIGMVGAGIIFTARKPKIFFTLATLGFIAFFTLILPNLQDLLYDTRFYSFINAYNIINEFPFGVGLGGYPVYTEAFHRQLYANFYDVNALLDYIPLAPESDIVHLFGSLGLVLGSLHLFLQLRIVWYAYALQPLMNSFQKCILFYFCFMTFFGISEDSIFSINYWIFFGLASGITASLLYKRKFSEDV